MAKNETRTFMVGACRVGHTMNPQPLVVLSFEFKSQEPMNFALPDEQAAELAQAILLALRRPAAN